MKLNLSAILLVIAFLFVSCGEKTDIVESGTYRGIVDKVEASKTEIYVKTSDNKTLELYFTDNTSLTRNGERVEFSNLEEGQQVEVDVEKTGKRLDPIAVRILD
ncbi:hypothetical protein FK178_01980 [Antarcticibacterium arcticum]|uniref:DUF3221 domain-containing protein n=1 Tax=Antarcticibacterium arcticum TaxID=2585771 RepID=A0A5B8YIA0_9FLAO|nr:hypothetical protein [Antarcticibacterium arcticum]QED36557.1 hypothetical protein FK178_01980 [Antarcticibacterium arcticum]